MNNDAFQTMLAESVGTVWHDVVTEDIWNFLKKHKNPAIDFRQAQGIAYDKIRGRVLAYLSGGL